MSFQHFRSTPSVEAKTTQVPSTNSNKCYVGNVNMNSSIDEFLAEYYGPEYRAEHYGQKKNNDSLPQQVSIMGNFDVGGDALMTSMTEEEPTLESLPMPMSMLQLEPKPDTYEGSIDQNKIVNIRTRRQSLSYDIVFDQKHAVQIRITDSPTNDKTKNHWSQRIQLLEKELDHYKMRNAELEQEIGILKQKVQLGEQVVQRLEVELAQIYMFNNTP